MRYMLDMTEPPTTAQAAAMAALGYTVCAVYVGGPRAAAHDHWHQIDGQRYPVRDLVPYFSDGFLPICVGRNVPWDGGPQLTLEQGSADGYQANADTVACGLGPTAPIVLDVEYGTYEQFPRAVMMYIAGFISQVNAASRPGYVYGDLALMNALQGRSDLVDGLWLAWPQFSPTLTPDLLTIDRPAGELADYIPDAPPPPIVDAWQCGNGTVAGVAVDYSTVTDVLRLASYG